MTKYHRAWWIKQQTFNSHGAGGSEVQDWYWQIWHLVRTLFRLQIVPLLFINIHAHLSLVRALGERTLVPLLMRTLISIWGLHLMYM